MGEPERPRKTSPVVIGLAVVGGITILALIGRAMDGGTESGASTTTAAVTEPAPPAREAPPVPSATPRQYVAQGCGDFVSTLGTQSGLTALQAEARWEREYRGRWVRWTATVSLVQRAIVGNMIQVQFRCATGTLVFDGHAHFSADQRDALLRFQQGDAIDFEGRLARYGQVLGVVVEDATVTTQ